MRRAVWGVVFGLGLGILSLSPIPVLADSDRCNNYAHVRPTTAGSTVISSTRAKVCSVQIVGVGSAQVIDSPDGTSSHGQVRFVVDVANGTAGGGASTGPIDRFTEFGLAIETNNVDVFISWDNA